jgi:HSP20 family protein
MSKSFLKFIDAFSGPTHGRVASPCWCPAADVYQTPRGWLVKLDLAGVNPSEVRLERRGSALLITGTRRDALVQQDFSSYSLEISYNRFERHVELPADIESAEIQVEYRDGMLLVWLNTRSG